MKEILDNWNQFLEEQKSTSVDIAGIGKIPVEIYNWYKKNGGYTDQTFVYYTKELEELGNEVKRRLYKDFASPKALNSFIAHSRKKKSSDGTILDFFMPVKEMTRFYTRELLPAIKNIIEEVPILPFYLAPRDLAMLVFKKREEFNGLYNLDDEIIVINIFSPDFEDDKRAYLTIYEELIHAIDHLLIFGTAGDMFQGKPRNLSDVFGTELQKLLKPDAEILKIVKMGGRHPSVQFKDYIKDPAELYAKLRTLKAEYEDQYGEDAFNPNGTIKKDFLEKRFKDKEEADFLLDFFDIKKVDDLKKVIDQLVKVDKKMSKGSKMV
jgi:hypothetical protein